LKMVIRILLPFLFLLVVTRSQGQSWSRGRPSSLAEDSSADEDDQYLRGESDKDDFKAEEVVAEPEEDDYDPYDILERGAAVTAYSEAYADENADEESIDSLIDDVTAAVVHSTTETFKDLNKGDEDKNENIIPVVTKRTGGMAEFSKDTDRSKATPYVRKWSNKLGRYVTTRLTRGKPGSVPMIAYTYPDTEEEQLASQAGFISWMAIDLMNQNKSSRKSDNKTNHHRQERDLFNTVGDIAFNVATLGLFSDFGKHVNPEVCSERFLKKINKASKCSEVNKPVKCNKRMHYRTMDGRCNNLYNIYWGSALSPYWRFAPARYADDLQKPFGIDDTKVNGFALPSARTVSFIRLRQDKYSLDPKLSNMFTVFGQLVSQDIELPLGPTSDEAFKNGKKCAKRCEFSEPCMPIKVSHRDPKRGQDEKCMTFLRNSPACIIEKVQNCRLKREQVNTVTSFIDASMVYGNDPKTAQMLRDNRTGKLKWGLRSKFNRKKHNLPEDYTGHYMSCKYRSESSFCYMAGDIRVNENIGLSSLYTLLFREHNRIVDILRKVDPRMPPKMLYEEARKIVGATLQNIVYRDYLPLLLGHEGMKLLGPYKGYNMETDATASNEVGAAAFRTHNMISNSFVVALRGKPERIPFHLTQYNSAMMEKLGIDSILVGMMFSNQKMPDPRKPLSEEMTDKFYLMSGKQKHGLDMGAMEIQRGRDHGLQPYVEYVHRCGLGNVKTWDDLKHLIKDPNVLYELKRLYRTPYNIDLYAGGLSEDLVAGARVGPTFLCILVETFWRLRDGDRFWFENYQFTKQQLKEIKGTTLENLICRNSDNLSSVSRNVMVNYGKPDMVKCNMVKDINFSYWKGNPLAKKKSYVFGGRLRVSRRKSFYDYRPMTYGASKQSSNMPPYGRTPKHKLSSIPQNAAYDEPLMVKDEKSTLEEKEQA